MKICHAAIWAADIELLRNFYTRYFGATAGARYHNPAKVFTSYFLTFPDGGAALEIMNVPGIIDRGSSGKIMGVCHLAISVGSKERVDEFTERMRADGVRILSNPRTTGDGYYESVIADPEGNIVELTI